MGYALLSARKILLTSRINALNFELMRLSQQRQELLKYGTGICDGYLNFEEMAGMPMCMRPFATQYAMFGQGQAQMGAMQDANFMMMQVMSTPFGIQNFGNNPQALMAFQSNIFQQALKARLAEAKKAEEARIHVIENEIDMKQKRIETQLAAANQELQSVEKGEEQAIGRATPKYA